MIEEALATFLQAYAGLSALSAKFYALKLGDNPTFPAGIIRRASGGGRVRTIGGPIGLAHPVIEVEVQGATYSTCLAAAKQVRLALDGYDLSRGAMGAVTVHSIALLDADEEDGFDYETKKFTRTMPFEVWHEEALS